MARKYTNRTDGVERIVRQVVEQAIAVAGFKGVENMEEVRALRKYQWAIGSAAASVVARNPHICEDLRKVVNRKSGSKSGG